MDVPEAVETEVKREELNLGPEDQVAATIRNTDSYRTYVGSQCISVFVPSVGPAFFRKRPSANLIASRIKLPLPNRHKVLLDPEIST